jgi:hypothetical protein
MTPAPAKPSAIWMRPARTTDRRKVENDPSDVIAVRTMTASPAAGPETPSCDPLAAPTTTPPTMPAMMPEKSGAPEARAMPRHSGDQEHHHAGRQVGPQRVGQRGARRSHDGSLQRAGGAATTTIRIGEVGQNDGGWN